MIVMFDKAEVDSAFVEDGQEYVMLGGICLPNYSDTVFECELRIPDNEYLGKSVFAWLESKNIDFYMDD